MGHCISVYLISKLDLRDDRIDSILDDSSSNQIEWVELREGILATTNIQNIRKFGKNKTIAYIRTDYFGGSGSQSAKVFVDNKKVLDKDDENGAYETSPINSALRMLGISRKNGIDEFDVIGLGNYRSNSDFYK